MTRFATRLFTVVATAITLSLAAVGSAEESPKNTRLTILHTSDLHGSVLPFDDFTNQPSTRGSLAQVSTLAAEIRASVDHPVLLVDSGDTIQGTPLEQFVAVRWGEASPTIAAMNHIGYDAMAVGNHEFNYGLKVLSRAEEQAEFPLLSANIVQIESGELRFPPYTVLERGDLRIGVLGLITPNVPAWEKQKNYAGLTFEPMDVAARRWVRVLRIDENCDLVIVLAHTGFEYDPDDVESDPENYLGRLAEVEGIDVIMSGHTHADIAPHEVGGVIVSQPSARARMLTRIDLVLEENDDGWQLFEWEGVNLPTGAAVADEAMLEKFKNAHARVIAALDDPVGAVTGTVRDDRCRLEDCSLLDFLHQVQLEASGADLSLASLLAYSTPTLEPGPVTWRWIHAFYVYPNTLTAVRLTGDQVRDVLEHMARYYDDLDCSKERGCTVRTDPDIPHYNVDNMAGLSYRIDPTRPEGSRIRNLRYRGRELAADTSLTVACTSYRSAGGGNYPHLSDAEVVWWSSEELTDLIGAYLERHLTWQPTTDANWWIGREMVAEERSTDTDADADADAGKE